MDDYRSEFLPIHLHSDGIISFTEMVAELAYRCIVLNGNKRDRAIKDTHGVVMIDELDLHLHPNWQRRVVQDLKTAFPNIQFVATTHSPFIVQSLESNALVNLDADEAHFAPDEMTLNKVATEIMGVTNIRSDNFEARFKDAKEKLSQIGEQKKNLTLDDYREVSEVLGKVLKEETNDPVYKAYLEETENEE